MFTGLMYLVFRYHLLAQGTKQVNKKQTGQLYKGEFNKFVGYWEMDIRVSILVSTSGMNLNLGVIKNEAMRIYR